MVSTDHRVVLCASIRHGSKAFDPQRAYPPPVALHLSLLACGVAVCVCVAVAADTAAFLSALLGVSDWSTIDARVGESAAFVQPIVDALLMEGYAEFLPPCLCEEPDEYYYFAANATPPFPGPFDDGYAAAEPTEALPAQADGDDGVGKLPYRQFGTCASKPHCTGGSPWTATVAAPTIAGASNGYYGGIEGLTVKGVDSLHIVTEEKPSCHLPHIHGGGPDRPNFGNPGSVPPDNGYNPLVAPLCASPSDCQLNVTTVTQHVYENSGEFDLWRLEFHVDSLDTG